jgi:hypothetical protein
MQATIYYDCKFKKVNGEIIESSETIAIDAFQEFIDDLGTDVFLNGAKAISVQFKEFINNLNEPAKKTIGKIILKPWFWEAVGKNEGGCTYDHRKKIAHNFFEIEFIENEAQVENISRCFEFLGASNVTCETSNDYE